MLHTKSSMIKLILIKFNIDAYLLVYVSGVVQRCRIICATVAVN